MIAEAPLSETRPGQQIPEVEHSDAVTHVADFKAIAKFLANKRPPAKPNRTRPRPAEELDRESWKIMQGEMPSASELDEIFNHLRTSGQATK